MPTTPLRASSTSAPDSDQIALETQAGCLSIQVLEEFYITDIRKVAGPWQTSPLPKSSRTWLPGVCTRLRWMMYWMLSRSTSATASPSGRVGGSKRGAAGMPEHLVRGPEPGSTLRRHPRREPFTAA